MIGPAPGHLDDQADGRPHVVFVCTGNAARSVMATLLLRRATDRYRVTGSGTHVIEGHVMSTRTRNALARHGLADSTHRSRQFGQRDASAHLILTMEPAHVRWVRRHWPAAADRTTSLKRAIGLLADANPLAVTNGLATLVERLDLATFEPEPWEEVLDPGAGDQPLFDACIDELADLVRRLALQLP